jgi:hypothetical protein
VLDLGGSELVGYVASLLVVLSLAMTSVVRLRTISLAGAITFVVYGLLIGSVPIVLTNGAIAVLNVWFLSKELRVGPNRGVDLGATVIPSDSPYLQDFVRYHLTDIHRFQPDFRPADDGADGTDRAADDPRAERFALMLTRDGLPAGILLGHRTGTTLTVDLDYVLAAYRDSRLGKWLFGPGADVFRRAGISTVLATAVTDTHRRYLRRSGFESAGDDTLRVDL